MTGEPNDEGKAQQDLKEKLWQSFKIYVKDHQQYIHDQISDLEAGSPDSTLQLGWSTPEIDQLREPFNAWFEECFMPIISQVSDHACIPSRW